MSLESLYQEIILEHYKSPRNFGPLPEGAMSVIHENPLCGDHMQLYVEVEGGRIQAIRFSGNGCAISVASASMMTEQIKGLTVEEALEWLEHFLGFMRGENELAEEEMGELIALQGVRHFPVRVKCATLAWNALREALENQQSGEGKVEHCESQ